MKTESIRLNNLPTSAAELTINCGSLMRSPAGTVALTIAALCLYPDDRDESIRMLNFLRGPRPLSVMEQQFIRDRFMDGVNYIPRSYFQGATPDNNYTPARPYTIEVIDYERREEENYKTLYVRSGGADTPRPIKLRLKPSEGVWYLWEQSLLVQIRIPRSLDPWA